MMADTSPFDLAEVRLQLTMSVAAMVALMAAEQGVVDTAMHGG